MMEEGLKRKDEGNAFMRFAFLLVVFSLLFSACDNGAAGPPTHPLTITRADGSTVQLKVEIAADDAARAYGLMNRTSMPDDHGMLFVFPDNAPRTFWMHNTLIPLDMLFIAADGTILHIHANAHPNDDTPIPSRFAVPQVLEINGGAAAKWGVKEGDRVSQDYNRTP